MKEAQGACAPDAPVSEGTSDKVSQDVGRISDKVTQEVQRIAQMFTIDGATLRRITDHFVHELEKGLSNEDSDIPMNVTWVMKQPTGYETGRYLTVDMGGTNLRVCNVILTEEKGGYELTQDKFKLPKHLRNCTADELWAFVADRIGDFIQEHNLTPPESEKLPLAFTFSYPVTQDNIRHGVLQRWTKGWNISGVEGHDVVAQLEQALDQRNIPVRIVALVNDTTGTLIASAYKDPEVKIGSIFGTGCNAAYMEKCGRIPKIAGHNLPADQQVAINTEYGAFDNSHQVLPRCPFDLEIDQASPRPGQQTYEKMVAGLYTGELVRLMIVHLHETVGFLGDCDLRQLRDIHAMESSCLSRMEEENAVAESTMAETRAMLKQEFGIEPTLPELKTCCQLAEMVCTRAARLYACGIAAICKKEGITRGRAGVDGSAFSKNYQFKERAAAALREILEWPADEEDLITFCPAEDGSGIGAALIAALTMGDN
ncbi:hexokinase [Aspergillus homomorphus CBS 101889]|uniref:Phosphotransferase n=1 Tax=Aspergillus homomorphus (strain CBS 101889) TaxID=1450537 RepID=A0A395HWZ9_ASPHC|nr:hexokinase [Aspergillus homomorphus CBS 101889]RAL12431.1 hexokinase [Aspergillus homomorphus CBS 101889]